MTNLVKEGRRHDTVNCRQAEPLLRIAKREGTTMPQRSPCGHRHLLALVVDAAVHLLRHRPEPHQRIRRYVERHLRNMTRFIWALRDLSMPAVHCHCAGPAFKMRFWNIGGEGQILIGGLAAALIMVYLGNKPARAAAVCRHGHGQYAAGALWGFVPAWFKSRWNTNETLFTLMMNYVATALLPA